MRAEAPVFVPSGFVAEPALADPIAVKQDGSLVRYNAAVGACENGRQWQQAGMQEAEASAAPAVCGAPSRSTSSSRSAGQHPRAWRQALGRRLTPFASRAPFQTNAVDED